MHDSTAGGGQLKRFTPVELSHLPVSELAGYAKRVPEISLKLEAYPLRYRYHQHLPVAIRQALAVPLLGGLWLGYEARLGTAHSQRGHLLLPFLLLYSRELDMYFKTGVECTNSLAFCAEVAKEARSHEYRFRARFRGQQPTLGFEARSKQLGGVCFKSKGARCDFGLVFRGNVGRCAVAWRATMDLNARQRLSPVLKASISRPLAPYATGQLYIKATRNEARLGASLTATVERYPVSLQLEFDGKVVLWAGVRLPGVGLRLPAWIFDPQDLGANDGIAGGALLIGLGGLLFAAARSRARRLREARRTFDAAFVAKTESDEIIASRTRVDAGKIDVLFAAVGRERVLETLCFAPFPFPAALADSRCGELINITHTCRFYADEDGLELPADKRQLLGYLRPLAAEEETLRVLVVYRLRTAAPAEAPQRLLQFEGRPLSIKG